MRSIDIIGFGLSTLGVYGLILYLRHLFPHYVVPLLSALLDETQRLLHHAEALCAIPLEGEYKIQLDLCDSPLYYVIVPHLIH
jgi:hypothetical protein